MGPRLGRVEYVPMSDKQMAKVCPASMGPRLGRVEYKTSFVLFTICGIRFNGATLRTRGIR